MSTLEFCDIKIQIKKAYIIFLLYLYKKKQAFNAKVGVL